MLRLTGRLFVVAFDPDVVLQYVLSESPDFLGMVVLQEDSGAERRHFSTLMRAVIVL